MIDYSRGGISYFIYKENEPAEGPFWSVFKKRDPSLEFTPCFHFVCGSFTPASIWWRHRAYSLIFMPEHEENVLSSMTNRWSESGLRIKRGRATL